MSKIHGRGNPRSQAASRSEFQPNKMKKLPPGDFQPIRDRFEAAPSPLVELKPQDVPKDKARIEAELERVLTEVSELSKQGKHVDVIALCVNQFGRFKTNELKKEDFPFLYQRLEFAQNVAISELRYANEKQNRDSATQAVLPQLNQRAQAELKAGRLKEAVDTYRELLSHLNLPSDPDTFQEEWVDAHSNLGSLISKLATQERDPTEKQRLLQQAHAHNTQALTSVLDLISKRREQGRYDDVINLCKQHLDRFDNRELEQSAFSEQYRKLNSAFEVAKSLNDLVQANNKIIQAKRKWISSSKLTATTSCAAGRFEDGLTALEGIMSQFNNRTLEKEDFPREWVDTHTLLGSVKSQLATQEKDFARKVVLLKEAREHYVHTLDFYKDNPEEFSKIQTLIAALPAPGA